MTRQNVQISGKFSLKYFSRTNRRNTLLMDVCKDEVNKRTKIISDKMFVFGYANKMFSKNIKKQNTNRIH